MDVRCEKCETIYELDDARVPENGSRRVKCTTCGWIFRVSRPQSKPMEPSLLPIKGQTMELELAIAKVLPEVVVTEAPSEVTVEGPNPMLDPAPTPTFTPTREPPWTASELKASEAASDFAPSFESDAPKAAFTFEPRQSRPDDTAAVTAAAFPKRPWKPILLVVLLAILGFLVFDLVRGNRKVLSWTSAVSFGSKAETLEDSWPEPEADQEPLPTVVAALPSDEDVTDSGILWDAGADVAVAQVPEFDAGASTSTSTTVPESIAERQLEPEPGSAPNKAIPLHTSLRLIPEEKLTRNATGVKSFAATLSAAEISRLENNLQPALKLYAKAMDMALHRPEPYTGRGLCWMGLSRWKEAETAFLRALKANKKYAPAFMGLGEMYRLRGKKELAIKQFQKAIEANPTGPEAGVARKALEALQKKEE